MKILVIPDTHDEPDVDKERFTWLGNYCVVNQPEVIVHLGDGLSLDSLCMYDVGKASAEGRRYSEDIRSFSIAMDLFHKELDDYNKLNTKRKKKLYKPKLIYTIGNHDNRILKAINSDPKLIGSLSLDDLTLKPRGWSVYPLAEPARVGNLAFAHYFTSGVMGRNIGGMNHAHKLIQKTYSNTVVGHSHLRDFYEDTNIYGEKVIGLVAGCYFEHNLTYSTENDRYWRGLVNLKVQNDFKEINPEFISIEEIKKEYS